MFDVFLYYCLEECADPVRTYRAAVRQEFVSVKDCYRPFELKIDTLVAPALGNVVFFCTFFGGVATGGISVYIPPNQSTLNFFYVFVLSP